MRIKPSRKAVRIQPFNLKDTEYTFCMLGNQKSIILADVPRNTRITLVEERANHNYVSMQMDMMMGKKPQMKVEQETPVIFRKLDKEQANQFEYYYLYELA